MEAEGCLVVPSAKPQLARLQESGLEARPWGGDVDPIDVGTQAHTRRPRINVPVKTRNSMTVKVVFS